MVWVINISRGFLSRITWGDYESVSWLNSRVGIWYSWRMANKLRPERSRFIWKVYMRQLDASGKGSDLRIRVHGVGCGPEVLSHL